MSLGFVLVGMVLGLMAAVVLLLSGAGLAMAALAYVGVGIVGTGLGVAVALWPRPSKKSDQARPPRVNALQNPK